MLDLLDRAFALLVAALMALSSLFLGTGGGQVERTDGDDYIGLKAAYEDYFKIGVAVSSRTMNENKEMILKNFNSITCENAMKVDNIHPAENDWRFGEADKIADFCRENGLVMRGHTLVWGQAYDSCPWMMYDGDDYASPELFYERMKDHIFTIIHRYDDVVYCWDVVNEALNYDKSQKYKDYLVYRLYGEEYVKQSFRFAAQALDEIGSDAKLFYNETKLARNGTKSDYTYEFLKELQAEGIRVDGLGIQGHYDFMHPNESIRRIEKEIKRFAPLGLDIEFTEVDMTVYNDIDLHKFETIPAWREVYQRERYRQIFKVYRDYAHVITNVTFWGVNDVESYRRWDKGGRNDWALLFDENSQPKSSYYAVTDFYFEAK
ncbi:MAG: endo-1,4-beta-xylanase [Clostridiales bacterium]|nr:endo-1,4-beta-xylanase [Clostridiales bacterium]